MQDTTNHPAWTGEENTVSSEDEHMARFLKRFGEQLSSSICIAVAGGTHTYRLSLVTLHEATEHWPWSCAEGLSAAGLPGRLGQDKAEGAADS